MAVTISGSGPITGLTTIASPTTINGLTIPTTSFGKLLQVVRATDATNRTTTSNVIADASISVTISPTLATSSILVIWTCQIQPTNADYTILLITNSSNTALSGAEFNYYGGSQSSAYFTTTNIGYSSPATTSATTYKGRFRSNTSVLSTIHNTNTTGVLYAIELGI